MVVIFVIVVALSRLEQEVTSYHLKDGASERPDVSGSIVISANNNLWRTILASLNFWGEMVMSPTSITHITYLHHHIFIDLWSSFLLWLPVSLVLLLLLFIV